MNKRIDEPNSELFQDELTEKLTVAYDMQTQSRRDSSDEDLDAILREAEELINGDISVPKAKLTELEEQSMEPEPKPAPRPQYIRPEGPSEKAKQALEESADRRQQQKKKRIIIICMATVVVLGLVFAAVLLMKSSSERQEYKELYDAAQLYFYDGNYDEALEELREAMKINKSDECLLLMSQCYEAKSDYDNAIAILESASSENSLITKRIEKLKTAKEEYEKGKVVLIAGEQYDIATTVLDLSNKKLKSGRLEDIGKLTELTNLKLAGNSIDDISFLSELSKLVSLDLSENEISDLGPIEALTELRTLHIDDNANIKDFSPLYRLRNLTMLTMSGIELKESQLKELKESLPSCLIYSDKANVDIVEISLGGKSFKSDVTKLDLRGCSITDISPLSVCTQLTELYLGKNFIRDISPLVDLANLTVLDLSDNMIKDIRPLMILSKLEHLNLENNTISSITPLSEMSSLKELVLNGNSISNTQTLQKLTSISILGLKNTDISDDDLQYLYKLKKLRELSLVGNSKLTENAVNKLHEKLTNCKITHSELIKNISLGTKSFAPNSETVEAKGLGLSDISAVAGFTNVKNLDLSGNVIVSVEALGALTTLITLDLSDNNIADVRPLYALKELDQLWIGGNGLSEEAIEALRQALPDCDISVE